MKSTRNSGSIVFTAVLAVALSSLFTSDVTARTDMMGREAPEIAGNAWLNSDPFPLAALRGQVVLVEFWTFGCWNCRNVEPHVRDWYARYAASGLTVVGVHTPEMPREHDVEAVRAYVRDHDIRYPVVVDNAFTTWERYGNDAWPALYLVDKRGRIRRVQVGEGGYAAMEAAIRALLAEA